MTADKHLHVIARNKGDLSGSGQHLTPEDVGGMFAGTAYRDEPALWNVAIGKLERGYYVAADGWVAVTWCPGKTQEECTELLVNVTVAGDLRAAKKAGLL
jgi:hypothetical protein